MGKRSAGVSDGGRSSVPTSKVHGQCPVEGIRIFLSFVLMIAQGLLCRMKAGAKFRPPKFTASLLWGNSHVPLLTRPCFYSFHVLLQSRFLLPRYASLFLADQQHRQSAFFL